jgi:hypothetical protein
VSDNVLNQSHATADRFVYVQTDVPPGMTLRAWRRARHPRRHRGVWQKVACALHMWDS